MPVEGGDCDSQYSMECFFHDNKKPRSVSLIYYSLQISVPPSDLGKLFNPAFEVLVELQQLTFVEFDGSTINL